MSIFQRLYRKSIWLIVSVFLITGLEAQRRPFYRPPAQPNRALQQQQQRQQMENARRLQQQRDQQRQYREQQRQQAMETQRRQAQELRNSVMRKNEQQRQKLIEDQQRKQKQFRNQKIQKQARSTNNQGNRKNVAQKFLKPKSVSEGKIGQSKTTTLKKSGGVSQKQLQNADRLLKAKKLTADQKGRNDAARRQQEKQRKIEANNRNTNLLIASQRRSLLNSTSLSNQSGQKPFNRIQSKPLPGRNKKRLTVIRSSSSKNVLKTSAALFGSKIEGQLAGRGWTKDLVRATIDKPVRTVKWRDTRYLPSGGRMNDPATAYYSQRGGYVVRNDRTGDIIQVSNRTDPTWKAPWD